MNSTCIHHEGSTPEYIHLQVLENMHKTPYTSNTDHALRAQLYHGVWCVLIKWHSLPDEDATWEPLQEFQDHYPTFQLDDELFVEGGRDVMTGITYTSRRRSV